MNGKPAVWLDFENAPHVWVLTPIIDYLRREGYPLILTARDFSCTVGLCQRLGHSIQVVGRPGIGKSDLAKRLKVGERALSLYVRLFGHRKGVALALSHGSRSQILAAHYLGLPVVVLNDYEFSDQSVFRFVDHLLMPFPIPKETRGRYADRVVWYPGLKEELYLYGFHPRESGLEGLGDSSQIRVLMRPEGRFTHYRSAQSEILQGAILEYLAQRDNVQLVLLPRDAEQGRALARFCTQHHLPYWIPQEVLDGPALIWEMDLVIGGGGTMTREAAVLGIPSYSFFAGQWGGVDRHLQAQGRLIRLADKGDVQKIKLTKRGPANPAISDAALNFVTGFIEGVIRR